MPNALASEFSPYLRQHADNPVDWLPWGEAAFAKARAEQKPVFLSIGYATCHWCHVMAHESFEDPAVAALLNQHFVSIKVDREERPDVDRVYMTYVQALTGHGGWPLSAWLTPDLKPFFGGTYFPPADRQGRPGFASVLEAIAKGWAGERDKLISEAERIIGLLTEQQARQLGATPSAAAEDLTEPAGDAFEKAYQYLYENYDAGRGGFGGAPKFPRASNLNFLFRCAVVQGVESDTGREAVDMAAATVAAMARGGIHDHVGGGFHRYSVDEAWFVPHFEKMLYDQAQIAVNALDAHLFTGREAFAWLARGIFDYVLRDLAAPAGGFYSAEDADSAIAEPPGGAEGAFYVWTPAELTTALGDEAGWVGAHFGVLPEGNVPAALDPHGELRGKNILRQTASIAETARTHAMTPEAAAERLARALDRLRAVRAARPRPLRDEKILAAWNGLMIGALARGAASPAACLDDKREFYREAAEGAARHLERSHFDAARGVLKRTQDGPAAPDGFAEDYAYVIAGLLDLYEATFEPRWLLWADQLQRTMDRLFWDEEEGGYFNSAAHAADLVLRLKDDYDGAEPSANSVAASNLLRLAGAFHDDDLRRRALRTLAAFRARWSAIPQALPEMLCALERALETPRQVVLAGEPRSAAFAELAAVLRERPGRRLTVLAAHPDLTARAPWLAGMAPVSGSAAAYVCDHYTCQAPVTTPVALRELIAT
jgi:uncharacterized protein YyaL (SSP411 family)